MKKLEKLTIFLIPIGIAVNFVGGQLAIMLKLPLFLDAAGTLIVGAMCGGIPGALVGIGTGLINAISLPTLLPYMSIGIILDEPTAGQDLRGTKILSQLLDELQSVGIGVITITHDMEFVANNFSRVVAMANKRIIADGTMREVFRNDDILTKSRIKRPQIGEVAKELNLPGDVLFREELRDLLKVRFAGAK